MWSLALDSSVVAEPEQPQLLQPQQHKTTMSPIYHQICIEQITDLICQNFPNTWFHFFSRAVDLMKQNKYTITMQQVIRKLLSGFRLPSVLPGVPKTRTDLLRALDSQLKLAHVCISSCVDFKQRTLVLINEQNFGQQEDDNLETMSSLDDDDDGEDEDRARPDQNIVEEIKEAPLQV